MLVRDIADPGRYDSLYVAPSLLGVLLSCAGRLCEEQRDQGLRALVVALHDPAGDEPMPEVVRALDDVGADLLQAGLPRHALGCDRCSVVEPGPEDEQRRHEIARLLNDLRYRTEVKHAFLPLGAGGHVDHRVALDAGLEAFQVEAPRNVFLYEERPQLFVPASIRTRLGQIGARLPPASEVSDDAGLIRFLLGFGTARYLRQELEMMPRLRCARVAAREWRASRAWQPAKARGIRLQPVLQRADLGPVQQTLETVGSQLALLYGSSEKAFRQALAYSRRLGRDGEYVERYWLLLPPREEGGARTIPPGTSSSSAA